MMLSPDPVDERVVRGLIGPQREAYFPEVPVRLPDDLLVLDLGAHHGYYTVEVLSRYPRSRVIAVEPSEEAMRLVKKNIAINQGESRVRLVRAALSSGRGTVTLRHSSDGSWGHSLGEAEEKTVGTETVPALPLAGILGGERPHLVKCNAEGAEFELACQLEELKWRPQILIVAVHEWLGDSLDLLAKMAAMGYHRKDLGFPKRPVYHFWTTTDATEADSGG